MAYSIFWGAPLSLYVCIFCFITIAVMKGGREVLVLGAHVGSGFVEHAQICRWIYLHVEKDVDGVSAFTVMRRSGPGFHGFPTYAIAM